MTSQTTTQAVFVNENTEASLPKGNGVMAEGSYKVAFPIDGMGGVHEDITKAAAQTVGIRFNKPFEKGVEWPDVPSDKSGETSYYKLVAPKWAGGEFDKPGTPTYESHNGANQFFHSMAPSDAQYSNGEVLNKIVSQADSWYREALQRKEKNHYDNNNGEALFEMGKLLHMVQDSYSPAHVVRDENGAVVSFQAYDKQDHSKHSHAEEKQWIAEGVDDLGNKTIRQQTWQEVPGSMQAYNASVKILELYKNNAAPEELNAYLRKEVYPFQNEQTQYKPAGEIDPKYAPKEKTHIVETAPESNDKYALMAKAYLEKSPEEAVAAYPDLVHIHAKKAAISTQIADMPDEGKAKILERFDTIALKDISEGNITLMQTNSTINTHASNESAFG